MLATLSIAAPALADRQTAADPPPAERFVLTGLTIDGVSAYPLKELAPLYADYLAREVAIEDLVKVAQAITDKYRADGYFLSRAVVPPQAPGGHARIRVYEGYIDQVEVTGDAAPAVEALLSGLSGRRPLRLIDLERRLTLARDLPGVRPSSRIEPILDDPARHRLVVVAGLKRWSGSIYVDNRGSRSVGPVQANVRLAANSLVKPGDQMALSVLTVPSDPGEYVQGDIAYGASFGESRLRVAAFASRSRQGSAPLNNTVGTESQAVSLRLAHPLIRDRKTGVWAAVAIDGRHVEQSYRNGGAYSDDLRVARASVQGDSGTSRGSVSGYAQVSRGLQILGATRTPSRQHSRFDADGGFWKVNVGASRYRDIGRKMGVYVSADAQWSRNHLLLSEEFAPGGLPYGRAYNYGEISGDSGVGAMAELRYGFTPKKASPVSFVQAYTFIDGAKVWNRPSAYSLPSAAFSSAGGGLRVTVKGKITARIEAARPLTRTPYETGDKDWRVFGGISASF
jgi:hemolysin activation/secretion protein